MSDKSDARGWRSEAADLLELRGLTAEARTVRQGAGDVDGLTGDDALRALRQGLPLLPRRLLEVGAVTPSEMLTLVRQAGVLTLPDLRAAIDSGRIASLLSSTKAERLRSVTTGLEFETRPVPIGRALDILEDLIAHLRTVAPSIDELLPAGDTRRVEPLISSLVLAGRASDPAAVLEAIKPAGDLKEVKHRSPRRAIVVFRDLEVDVRIAPPEEFGTLLFRATGSPAHVTAVERRRAAVTVAAREEDLYAHAGLAYIPPELRQAAGEIEVAANHELPALVAREHIRGDLHLHSTYSDGRDALEVMVATCAALGYEYIAITDHSERAGASRTVAVDQLARQRDEIARLRERYPRMAILHGIEVDIMPDGSLDFADSVLETLDIVLASLHDSAGHDGKRLTARALQAVRHPLVNVLTHPGNRMVGRRGPYPLDYAALYATAAETGTALEIDGAPAHLDLDGEQARDAVRAGVTVVIDSDCHRADRLERQMLLGVGTARRGWVQPRHVLNTRPIEDVRAFIAAKRRGKGPVSA